MENMQEHEPHFEDRQLARRVLKGEEAAFDTFFSRYYVRAYRYCQRRAADDDAEEIAMEAIRQAIRRIETYRGEASLMTWIYQIVRRQLSAHYKRERKHENLVLIDDNEFVQAEVEAMSADLSRSPEALTEAHQHTQLVHLMLDYLPGNYGRILEWKYIEGYNVTEIAERLNTTPTAIQSMLARARTAFKDSYENLRELGHAPARLSEHRRTT
jgi:RNA polymerase sigma-70 factor (ECF subfamily)